MSEVVSTDIASLVATFGEEVVGEAQLMLTEDERRQAQLFPQFNQFTGEGIPTDRTEVWVDDLAEGIHWWVPTRMLQEDMLWAEVARLHSIHAASMSIYGYYDEEIHETLIPQLLQAREKYDYFFFAIFCWTIRPKDFGDDIPFKLRAIQMRFICECEQSREHLGRVCKIVLKARQAGISTVIDSYIGWYQLMWEKSKDSLIVGHQSDASVEVEDMYRKAIENLPDHVFFELGKEFDSSIPKIAGSKTRNISHIPHRNCKIKTGSAVNPESARGGASALIHYTEVAFWQQTDKINPRALIKSATSAAGGRAGTMLFFESTPNGQNFYKDEWDRAGQVDEYGNKVSSFDQFFIAWYMIDIYRKPISNPLEFACTLIQRRNDDATDTNHWKYFYWLWIQGATLSGINWYTQTCRDYQTLDDMQQEFASDPIEAFKYAGSLEYDLYLLEQKKRYCKPCKWRGDLEADAPKGDLAMRNIHFVDSPAGAMQVWERPEKDNPLRNRYLVSVDIGGKYKTSDYSVITVFDRADMMLDESGTLNEEAGPTVVAEWYGHTDPDLLAIKCAQVASWYDNAILVIENNTAYSRYNGTANDDVTELFFPVLIPLYDNIYKHNHSELKVGGTSSETKYGFNTNHSTKTSVVKYLGICLRDNLYVEREKGAIMEMQCFMRFPNGKFGAVPGKHDDRVMSRAIGLYVSRFDWNRYPVTLRPTKQQRQATQKRVAQRSSAQSVILAH